MWLFLSFFLHDNLKELLSKDQIYQFKYSDLKLFHYLFTSLVVRNDADPVVSLSKHHLRPG